MSATPFDPNATTGSEQPTLPPLPPNAPQSRVPFGEKPGDFIGPYRLLELIGEGGFGTVWLAERREPMVQRVAIKVIKPGMDTRQVVARFEQERQALAMMDHPNIAKVLDAGTTQTGRPFFVMELVKGDPIVEYCDKNNVGIEGRLELVAQVCNAVQHAHTKGIIHRDIKPSNVLVSSQDGRTSIKVIDFGIAKATASKLTDHTLFTEHRQLIGTPEYMSPEQAEGNPDIDTRTDVYSLGVLLYELLTGTTPFSGAELRSAAYAEIQRIIREIEPPKPSTRLSANSETIDRIAAKRSTEARRLGAVIRGELDWIVMKALEKDRQRRYETANGLGQDIRRYLGGEAVVAAPPSRSYQLRKFIGRNRATVAGGGAVAAALLIGAIAFAWQAKVASSQRDLAVQAEIVAAAQRQAADAARAEAVSQQARAEAQEAEARKQADIAEAVAKFQNDMLSAVDPENLPEDPVTHEKLKDKVTVVQAMEAAVKVLDQGSLSDRPQVEARVRRTIGNTFAGLGRNVDAEPNLRKSLALYRSVLPAGHPDLPRALDDLAKCLADQNRIDEAVPLFRESIALCRAIGQPRALARSLNNLAPRLPAEEAEPMLREALALTRAERPAGDRDTAACLTNLAAILKAQDKPAEAEPLYREALDMFRSSLPAKHTMLAIGLANLANVLADQNKLAEAEPLARESLEIMRATLPDGHPDLARGVYSLAVLYAQWGKVDLSVPLLEEAQRMYLSAPPADPWDLLDTEHILADLYAKQGKSEQSLAILRSLVASSHAMLRKDSPELAGQLSNLADSLRTLKAWEEAEPLIREVLSIREQTQPDGWKVFSTKFLLGENLLNQKKLVEAEPLLLDGYQGLKAREESLPPLGRARVVEALNGLVQLYDACGNKSAAAEWQAKLDAAKAEVKPAERGTAEKK